jgi:Integrase core domain
LINTAVSVVSSFSNFIRQLNGHSVSANITPAIRQIREMRSDTLFVRTSFRSPWQNGVPERWVGSVRRELLDHVIVLNQRHLRRLLKEYVRYYHEDWTHLGLRKDMPDTRVAASAPSLGNEIVSLPRLGGLHHRYETVA